LKTIAVAKRIAVEAQKGSIYTIVIGRADGVTA
jgi:hypothetical protein